MSSHYRRNHPSALDISFGDSPPAISDAGETEHRQNKRSIDTVSRGYSLNEGNPNVFFQPEPDTAQSNLPPSLFTVRYKNIPLLTASPGFRSNEGVSREEKDSVIPGEPPSRGEKPVRILNNFTFFSRERDAFAELDDLAYDGYNSTIEGVGEVLAVRGEEMPDEDEDVDEPILLHLTPIINASIDYEKHNECVFVYLRH